MIIAAVVVVLAPVCTSVGDGMDWCVICDAYRSRDSITVCVVPVWSWKTSGGDCIGPRHRWQLSSLAVRGLFRSANYSGALWQSVRDLPWGPWLEEDPDGPDQARVLSAIREATHGEVRDLVGWFGASRADETGEYLWSTEEVIAWADRVHRRIGSPRR